MADPAKAERHRRARLRLERLQSLPAHRHHARTSRHLGRRTALVQAA